METAINMPQSHGLSSGDNIVQNLKVDPNISSNLLQTALNMVNPGNNVMQSAQATPTSSSSPLDHQGSAIGNLDSDPSQPDNNSNNKPQHPISTSQLKKIEVDLEERHRISMECMKQNLSMQHERDLQIVRDEAQRKIDDAINQARLSEEKAIAQSRKIEDLQSQMHQMSQLIRQQQQLPPNIATPQYNMQHQQNLTLPPPTHTGCDQSRY